MHKIIQLKKAEAKYWIGELPELPIEHKLILKKVITLPKHNKKSYVFDKICLEIDLHKNAGNYGLLGIEYNAVNDNILTVEIAYIKENQIKYKSEITEFNDYMFVGLLEDYTEGILDKIKYLADAGVLSGGTLRIPVATNCEVGSSPRIYGYILEMVLKIMENLSDDKKVEEVIKRVFDENKLF